MRKLAFLLVAVTALALPPAAARAQSAARVDIVRHDAEQRVDVLVDGVPFTSYIWPSEIKKPVLYPIRAASGAIVTRGFPLAPRPGEHVDHPHQVGMWLTHEDVNGLDFWNNSTAIPAERAPKMGTIVQRAIRGVRSGAGSGTLDVTTEWVDFRGHALLREDTRFVFGAAVGRRTIDRLTTLTALGDTVRFTDQKDGFFGMRVARALEQPATHPEVSIDASGHATTAPVLDNSGVTGHYRSSEGLAGDSVWGTRARWVTLEGDVDGKPVTLAILDHPRNPGSPAYWHARGYGLFAANPLGARIFSQGKDSLDLRLAPGQSTTFRYRVLILDAHSTPEQIEREYRRWATGDGRWAMGDGRWAMGDGRRALSVELLPFHAPRATRHAPRATRHAPRATRYAPRATRDNDFRDASVYLSSPRERLIHASGMVGRPATGRRIRLASGAPSAGRHHHSAPHLRPRYRREHRHVQRRPGRSPAPPSV